MKTEIVQYVRDEYGNRTGVVVACLFPDDNVVVSFSKCHKHLDNFDRERALDIARGRAKTFYETRKTGKEAPRLHSDVLPIVAHVLNRATSYFKNAKSIVTIPHRDCYEAIDILEQRKRENDNYFG